MATPARARVAHWQDIDLWLAEQGRPDEVAHRQKRYKEEDGLSGSMAYQRARREIREEYLAEHRDAVVDPMPASLTADPTSTPSPDDLPWKSFPCEQGPTMAADADWALNHYVVSDLASLSPPSQRAAGMLLFARDERKAFFQFYGARVMQPEAGESRFQDTGEHIQEAIEAARKAHRKAIEAEAARGRS